jgi:hypothetical protein
VTLFMTQTRIMTVIMVRTGPRLTVFMARTVTVLGEVVTVVRRGLDCDSR